MEGLCGIIVLQFVSHPPSGYGIWFYCDCAPPTISLRLLLCIWMWGIFFGELQCLPVDGCSAVSCDSGALAGGSERTSFYSAILNQSPLTCWPPNGKIFFVCIKVAFEVQVSGNWLMVPRTVAALAGGAPPEPAASVRPPSLWAPGQLNDSRGKRPWARSSSSAETQAPFSSFSNLLFWGQASMIVLFSLYSRFNSSSGSYSRKEIYKTRSPTPFQWQSWWRGSCCLSTCNNREFTPTLLQFFKCFGS